MKASINVANRQEGELLKAGLADSTVRAFVQVVGVLTALPTDAARRRVLTFVTDKLAEDATAAKIE